MAGAGANKMGAWIAMLVATTAVTHRLDDDLQQQHGISLYWFDVLNRLDQAGGRLRLRDLEERSVFTRSGMTRVCDRMENAGLVSRERSETDRRGVEIAITSKGSSLLASVWPEHRSSIEEHFARFVTDADARALKGAAEKVLDGLGESRPVRSRRASGNG